MLPGVGRYADRRQEFNSLTMNDGIKFASITAIIGCLLQLSYLVGADLLSEQFTGGIPQPAAHPKPPREVLNCLGI